MKAFLERVKRIRANQATDEDMNDKSLPDLNQIIPQMQFSDAEWATAYNTTNDGQKIATGSPMYYSSKISDQEQKIYASEAEVKVGEQSWDLNPLIFYRVKKPSDQVGLLPLIDLAQNFKQSEQNSQFGFIIQTESIN